MRFRLPHLWFAVLLASMNTLQAAPPERPPESPVKSPRWGVLPDLPEIDITFLLTSDLSGRFITPPCSPAAQETHLGHLLDTIEQERARIASREELPPILIDAGDLLGPTAWLRHVTETSPIATTRIREAIRGAGYDLHLLGGEEMRLDPGAFDAFVALAGLPFAAANLQCGANLSPRCALLRQSPLTADGHLILQRGGLQIAIVPVMEAPTHHFPGSIGSNFVHGDPLRIARESVARARRKGADVVVLLVHVDDSKDGPRRVLRFARRVRGADLVLTNGVGSTTGLFDLTELRFGSTTHAPIFASGGSPYTPTRVRVHLAHLDGRFRVTDASARPIHGGIADPRLSAVLEKTATEYCAVQGQPIIPEAARNDHDPEQFIAFLLDILRWDTESEIAMIHRNQVELAPWARVPGGIPRDFLLRSLPWPDEARAFEVTGDVLLKWLPSVFPQSVEEELNALRFQGIEQTSDGYLVNSRIIHPNRNYRIVTSTDVIDRATSLPGLLPPGATPLPTDEVGGPNLALGPRLERWFQEARFESLDAPAGAGGNLQFPDLANQILWTSSMDLNLAFNQTLVNDETGYASQPSLSRDEFLGLEGGLKLRVDAESTRHAFNNVIDTGYAASKTANEPFSESRDLTLIETSYSWLGMQDVLSEGSAWMPAPQARLRLETELTAENDWRHLELTGVLGVQWRPAEGLSIGLGYSIGGEIQAPDVEIANGLDLVFEIKRRPLTDVFQSPVYFEARFDLFYTEPGIHDTVKGTLASKLSFALTPILALTLGADAFVYRTDDPSLGGAEGAGPGIATDFTVGIQAYYAAIDQLFR